MSIALGGACGGKVAFDGLPSGGTTSSGASSSGGHGGASSASTSTAHATTAVGTGGSTGDVNPVTAGVGGAGPCINTCAERITDPCPVFCPNAPATAVDAFKSLAACTAAKCAMECIDPSGFKCGSQTCGLCLEKQCPMEGQLCANN